ncbi:MAG: peroxidase family protein [Isosphaeraceae bacterium]
MKNGKTKVRAMSPLEPLEDRVVLATTTPTGVTASAFYRVDGTGNNLANPDWGSAGSNFLRLAAAAYADGLSSPAGSDLPSARVVSNAIADQGGQDVISARMLSAMIYAWGQFLDHDLDLTAGGSTESFPIGVPQGDPWFDPAGTGASTIRLTRSAFDPATGVSSPREQVNMVTAWLDGSMVYGSDATTAAALRTFSGGRLKMDEGGLLPTNDASTFPDGALGMANDAHRVSDDQLFAAGDVRANENVELTSLHTLFVREHNRLADAIQAANPSMTDEEIHQRARARVIGEIQAITFNEWLPALLGPGAIAPYQGYDPSVNPGISNEFATAAFRLGHSLLGDDVEFLNDAGLPVAEEIGLKDAFSNPDLIRALGIDSVLKYLASDPASELDTMVVDGVRNFLFGPPGSGGLDLVSLNVQRGRDHGLADYNAVREAIGLARVTSFDQITSNRALQETLRSLYETVDDVDLWVGGLAEDHVAGGSVGPTFRAILADQFTRLRDGDRFWYENALSGDELREVNSTTLAEVIERNTRLTNVQDDAFFFDAGVRGVVFNDANRDGRQGGRERGLAGQTVELRDAATGEVVATTQTDAQGAYAFGVADGVRTGRYTIQVIPPTTRGGATTPVAIATVAVTKGGEFPEVNLGLTPPKGPSRFARNDRAETPRRDPVAPPVRTPASTARRQASTTRTRASAASSALTRRVFDGIRQDMLARARIVLGPSQFAAFAAGLDGQRTSSLR